MAVRVTVCKRPVLVLAQPQSLASLTRGQLGRLVVTCAAKEHKLEVERLPHQPHVEVLVIPCRTPRTAKITHQIKIVRYRGDSGVVAAPSVALGPVLGRLR